MNADQLDRLSRLFATRRLSRRRAIQQGAAGLAAAGLVGAGSRAAAAQDGTPAAEASPAVGETAKTEFLFVQSFEGGTIAPKDGADGTYTLTLQHGLGQTIYFSDRPERIVGASPTSQFLAGLGFSPDNPPNAALVVDDGNGGTDIAVIELTNPAYDEASFTATYDATVLQDYERDAGMQFQEATADLAALAPAFGSAHLFIDDCPETYVECINSDWIHQGQFDSVPFCYNYGICMPCEPYGHTQPDTCATANYWSQKCNSSLDACSSNQCEADFFGRGLVCAL